MIWSMQLSLRTYDSLAQLEPLRSEWDELLSCYPCATTFSTWEWLSSWWNCFGSSRRLRVLALFDTAKLVGLAPLSISRERHGWFSFRVLRLMGDGTFDSDNLDLPVVPGWEKTFAEIVMKYLREHKNEWDICRLNTLPPSSLVGAYLAEQRESSSWTFVEYSSKSAAVALPDSWDLYLRMLSSEDRKNLARYTRRLEARHAVRIYRCSESDQLQGGLEALFRLHQGRWEAVGEPGTFSSPERRSFYAQLSQHLLARGWLELWVLELDGEIAAVQFAFHYRDRVFQLQEGYDRRRTSDRLGFVLRGHVLRQLIAEDVRAYDFMGGDDSYKQRWAAREGHYRQLHFAPAFSLGGIWLRFANNAGRVKEWLREALPESGWSFLHRLNMLVRGWTPPPNAGLSSHKKRLEEDPAHLRV